MTAPQPTDTGHAPRLSTTYGVAEVARALSRLVPPPVLNGWRALTFFFTSSSE